MLGATPEGRARTRELVSVIDDAATQFGIWCHKGSPAFAGREVQSLAAAAFAAVAYHARLRLLDALMQEIDGEFLAGRHVTIADCVAMATLQFAAGLYGVPVPHDCSALAAWYARFALRPSSVAPFYPGPLLSVAFGLREHGVTGRIGTQAAARGEDAAGGCTSDSLWAGAEDVRGATINPFR